MKLAMIGCGYVGLVTGTCFADMGNIVTCVDNNKSKIDQLKKGISPIYEPGIETLIQKNMKNRRLRFSTLIRQAVADSEIIFIAVGTPPRDNGEADLTYIEDVACEIAKAIKDYKLIVEKSTVPVETGWWVAHTLKANARAGAKFDVASNPEFLREGTAINDFMHPDRIVIGVENKRAKDILLALYRPFKCPIVVTDIKSAELIKHASNSFLATKLSFINALSCICDFVGADVVKVAEGMGLDKRIGRSYLDAGLGYGGFCLPKDVEAFIRISEKKGYDFKLLQAVKEINDCQLDNIVKKIEEQLWILKNKTIGILGLSFKPNTDDLRFAPSLELIRKLQAEGAQIKAYDPQAMSKAKSLLKKVEFCKNVYDLAKNSDALIVVTEWDEFKEMELKRIKKLMKKPVIIDGRNIYEPKFMKQLGFKYVCIGR
ncbi:MAG: UDP-glucose/GDP-mannose dehydrogenase family protein [Candidatus Omnitrophota bacterium]